MGASRSRTLLCIGHFKQTEANQSKPKQTKASRFWPKPHLIRQEVPLVLSLTCTTKA
jgi:hypothetical protein